MSDGVRTAPGDGEVICTFGPVRVDNENLCHRWMNIFCFEAAFWLWHTTREGCTVNNGSQSGNRRNGVKSTSTHRSFCAQLDPARNLSHLHVRAVLRQTLPVARVFLGLSDLLAVRVRGPDPLLPRVPSRHQTGWGHDPDHDVPRRHFLQPERFPLQPRDAQRPVPRRGAAGPSQPKVAVKEKLIESATNLISNSASATGELLHLILPF